MNCVCGHVEDEHDGQKFFSKCLVDDCECLDFDLDDEESEDEAA